VKSHGGTDAFGFEFAIMKAVEEARNNIVEKISAQLDLAQLSANATPNQD
jgi:fatty acid/phospholipid biosynthesis enzyme